MSTNDQPATPRRLLSCGTCGQLQHVPELERGQKARCTRCKVVVAKRSGDTRRRTFAFALAGIILYIPANYYPIMTFEFMGLKQHNTVFTGAMELFKDGMWEVAVLVFLASILIPFLKLVGLLYLSMCRPGRGSLRSRTTVYRVIDVIGRWSMLDVFLMSILVALVKLGALATVVPGIGLPFFAAVVVITMIGAMCFDPQSIWEGAPVARNDEENNRRLSS